MDDTGSGLPTPARHGQNERATGPRPQEPPVRRHRDGGGARWATICSLIETCQTEQASNPHAYLRRRAPRACSTDIPINRLDELLPWAWQADGNLSRHDGMCSAPDAYGRFACPLPARTHSRAGPAHVSRLPAISGVSLRTAHVATSGARTGHGLVGQLCDGGWRGHFAGAAAVISLQPDHRSMQRPMCLRERSGFGGNNALDQARSLPADGCSGREGGRVRGAGGVSSKASRTSIPVSFGMSKFGASLCANEVARTAPGEGRCRGAPRTRDMRRPRRRSGQHRSEDVASQRAVSCVIWRAAAAMFATRQKRRFSHGRRIGREPGEAPHELDGPMCKRIGFPHRVAQFAIDMPLAFAGNGERPWFAARLMPDQRMHELWIDAERAQGDQGDKVHHGQSQRCSPIGCRACIEAEIIPHPASTAALHARLRWRAEACRSSGRLMSWVHPSS